MTTINYTFAAGETKRVGQGKFFKIASSTQKVDCIFYNSNGSEIARADFRQGDAITDDDGFSYVEVTSAIGQDVEIHILPFKMVSSNLAGDVNALIRFDNLSIDGNQFFGGFSHLAGVGQYGYVGLCNPLGSGKRIVLTNFSAGSTSGVLIVQKGTVSLMTTLTGVPVFPSNKNLNGVAPQGRVRYASENFILTGTLATDWMAYMSCDTNGTPAQIKLGNSPFVLDQDEAIVVRASNVNETVTGTFSWQEDTI